MYYLFMFLVWLLCFCNLYSLIAETIYYVKRSIIKYDINLNTIGAKKATWYMQIFVHYANQHSVWTI